MDSIFLIPSLCKNKFYKDRERRGEISDKKFLRKFWNVVRGKEATFIPRFENWGPASIFFYRWKENLSRRVEREFENKKNKRKKKEKKITARCVAQETGSNLRSNHFTEKNQFRGEYVSIHSTICLDLANSNYGVHTYTRVYVRARSQSGIICSKRTKSFMRTLYESANTRPALFIFRTLFLLIIECCLARRTMEHRLCSTRSPPLVLKGTFSAEKYRFQFSLSPSKISNKSHQNNYLRTLNELES